MNKKTPIRKTTLFKSLAFGTETTRPVRKQDHDELARMLEIARDRYDQTRFWAFDPEKDVGGAFLWDATPHGYDYWHALYTAIHK